MEEEKKGKKIGGGVEECWSQRTLSRSERTKGATTTGVRSRNSSGCSKNIVLRIILQSILLCVGGTPSPWHVTWPVYGLAAPINTICVQHPPSLCLILSLFLSFLRKTAKF
jgi:hypothetical protein